MKGGDWEEYTNIFRVQAKATGWAFDRIQEAFEKVGNDEARKLSTVQKVMSRSTDYLRRMIDPAGGQGSVTMSYLCPHCNSFPLEDYVWLEETHQLVVCDLWKIRQPNWLLVVRTGESVNQAKVFKAHAVPQGPCKNLINAFKLLANQQKDGDSFIQSIVTDLCERNRKGIMDGLRNFMKVDNHCALEVGHLRKGSRSFKIRRPKCEEGSPEVLVRESPDELTLRAEEVGTQKPCINVDHIAKERWGPPLVMLTGKPSARRCTKASKEKDWQDTYEGYKEMSGAVG